MDDKDIINIVKQLIENLILIPEGSFLMGSNSKDKDARAEELPQHLVHIHSFLISKFLVTHQQWNAITSLSKVNIELPIYTLKPKQYSLPVANSSWYGALEFCNRLSAFTGLNITLPSEAQWEYICRAGTTTKYYWGDNFDYRYTTVVGNYVSNPWGLYAIQGNIRKWCLDHYHPNYEGAPNDGSVWLGDRYTIEGLGSLLKVCRGGFFYAESKSYRSASRFFAPISSNKYYTGIRICCSI